MAKKLVIPPISPAASGPLYKQIVDGFKREISEERLLPGALLPSFRSLAEDLLVSVITVKRAYEELEREGIILRKQGLGTFVSQNGIVRSREVKLYHAKDLMEKAVREAGELGLAKKDILRMLKNTIDEKERDGK